MNLSGVDILCWPHLWGLQWPNLSVDSVLTVGRETGGKSLWHGDDFWALYFCCVVNHAAEKWLSSLLAASCHTVIFIPEWKRNLRTLISRNSFSVAWLTVQTASHSSSCLALSLAILSRVYGATCGCQLELCPTAYHSSEIAMITCPAPTSGL